MARRNRAEALCFQPREVWPVKCCDWKFQRVCIRIAQLRGGIVKTLTSRSYVPVLVLLAFACLPVAAHADGITFEDKPIDSFSFGTGDTFTVVMDGTDALIYEKELIAGTPLAELFLEIVKTVDGVTTDDLLTFTNDTVVNFQFTDTTELTADVTFDYRKLTISETVTGGGDGNGGGTTAPEPSSVALLASGLLGLVGFGRKKLRS
jgi:hypothetical protein